LLQWKDDFHFHGFRAGKVTPIVAAMPTDVVLAISQERIMKTTAIAAALALSLGTSLAHAQTSDPRGWYAGIDVGASRSNRSALDDDKDVSLGINVGYRLHRNFAVEAAFAHLFQSYRDKLYSFILHLSGSSAISEDILQEVFLKIWRDRSSLTGIVNFNAYLFRMAQNQAINVLRRQSREALILAEIKRISAEDVHGGDILSAKEVQALLHKALNSLPTRQRRVYELGRVQGLKYETIAVEMNISVSTVRNHMVQALKSIREYLQNAYPSGILYALPLLAALR